MILKWGSLLLFPIGCPTDKNITSSNEETGTESSLGPV